MLRITNYVELWNIYMNQNLLIDSFDGRRIFFKNVCVWPRAPDFTALLMGFLLFFNLFLFVEVIDDGRCRMHSRE